MAVNLITTTIDGIVNSTGADENFRLGTGEHTINFDLSNNNIVGDDIIELTAGEDLVLNFQGNGSSNQLTWERVQNEDQSTDIVINTLGYKTYGYAKCVVTASDEVDYVKEDGVTYYKSLATYYLFDYNEDVNDYVFTNTKIGRYYSTNNPDYNVTYYGQCYVNPNGDISDFYGYTQNTDGHTDYASSNGNMSSQIDYYNPVNTITIKNIGAQNAANSVKLQYQYVSGEYYGTPSTVVENFLTEKYDMGPKYLGHFHSSYVIPTENQTFYGSHLDETFWTGYGNDTINTVGGENIIHTHNGGNDVFTLGAGADTINATFVMPDQYYGDQVDLGTSTIANGGITVIDGNSDDTLQLGYGEYQFYKDNNDLVIIQNYNYYKRARLSKIRVKDYYTAETKIIIMSEVTAIP